MVPMNAPILITGGAGFIGSHFIRDWLGDASRCSVVNLDALTYAGNRESLADVECDARYHFVHGDIADRALVDQLLVKYQPRALLHFAAESHVDRSITGPAEFMRTNIEGTFTLLEAARHYFEKRSDADKAAFRFLHVSTDEVYGTLGPDDAPFSETTPYQPNSPYSASKAASDHLVRAWHHTYGLPVLTTNCSNNYGPYQFPEKLIPRMITNALAGKKLPIYGDGLQRRDWLYVGDHCAAIREVLARGKLGETYNIGGWNEQANRDVVALICDTLDRLASPASRGLSVKSYAELITSVEDRLGHDRRYAIDAHKIERELGWKPAAQFASAMEKTIGWYLANETWVKHIETGEYREKKHASA